MTGENTTPNQESGYDFKYGRRFHTQSSTVIPDDKQGQLTIVPNDNQQ